MTSNAAADDSGVVLPPLSTRDRPRGAPAPRSAGPLQPFTARVDATPAAGRPSPMPDSVASETAPSVQPDDDLPWLVPWDATDPVQPTIAEEPNHEPFADVVAESSSFSETFPATSPVESAVGDDLEGMEEVAQRLERIARTLRERGTAGSIAEHSSDPLAALIAGYLVGAGQGKVRSPGDRVD